MKSLMKACVLSVAMLVLMCGAAGASETFCPQGSTLVSVTESYINKYAYSQTYLTLTNVTDETVNCKITVYDQDGNDATYASKVFTGSSSQNWVLLSTGTGEFELPPYSSRMYTFSITSTNSLVGHAVIEWNSNNPKLRKALIGEVWKHKVINTGIANGGNYAINNGQPF